LYFAFFLGEPDILSSCGGSFTCIDCHTAFQGDAHKSHTSCISEAEKYQGKLYRGPKTQPPNSNAKPALAANTTPKQAASATLAKSTKQDNPKEATEAEPKEKVKKRKRSESTEEESKAESVQPDSKRAKKEDVEEKPEPEPEREMQTESPETQNGDGSASTVDLQGLKWRKVICKAIKQVRFPRCIAWTLSVLCLQHGGSADYNVIQAEVLENLLSPIKEKLQTIFAEKVEASSKIKVEKGTISMAKSK